jgi:hypothetical protein
MSGANEQDGYEEVDLDLTADDKRLREAVGKPTTVRIDGVVIHILHAAEWPSSATQAAAKGQWDDWMDGVIPDDDERMAMIDADLTNYQLEAVFEECGKAANMKLGKSRRSRR